MADLRPVVPPVGNPALADHPYPVNLILKEKVLSLTGDGFDVRQDPGDGREPVPVFKVNPSLLTSRKEFLDLKDGRKLFDLRKEHFHLVHEYMKLEDEHGNKFCEMKKNFKVGLGSKFTITFPGTEHVLVVEGNWRDSVAEIKLEGTGQVCVRVRRKSVFKSLSTFLFDQQTYMVTVAPGVDRAVAAAMCIVFDEWENEPGSS